AEHQAAIQKLPRLEEVVFCFDGDEAGRKGILKLHQQLKDVHTGLSYSYLELPNGEDANSILQAHEPAVFEGLMKNRKAVPPSFSVDKKEAQAPAQASEQQPLELCTGLDISDPECLLYTTVSVRLTTSFICFLCAFTL
ncbi:MAG: hypothetical protein D6816_13720, partial [Bacteroidetes bacterium]